MNKFLKKRKEALQLVKDIRTVRKIIHAGKFTDRMFDAINGADCALENLLGKTVLTAFMDEHDLSQVRREVLSKLTDNEAGALALVRESLENYFASIDKMLAEYSFVKASDIPAVAKVGTIKQEAKDALKYGVVDTGCYAKLQLGAALEAFDKVSKFFSDISPVMQRVIDESEEIVPEEGSTAAPPEKIEEPDLNDPDHQVIEQPDVNEASMTEVIAACASNVSMKNCIEHFNPNGGKITDLGYTSVEDIVESIEKINTVRDTYMKAVQKFRDVLPVATCVADDLNRGNDTFYTAVDAVVGLINKAEFVLENLSQTQLTLIDALESLERGM